MKRKEILTNLTVNHRFRLFATEWRSARSAAIKTQQTWNVLHFTGVGVHFKQDKILGPNGRSYNSLRLSETMI